MKHFLSLLFLGVSFSLVVAGSFRSSAFLVNKNKAAAAKPDRARPDTFIIRTDTLIDQIMVKDSAYRRIFRKDTARQTTPMPAVRDSNRIDLPEIITDDLNGLAVCPGSLISIPFSTTGVFSTDNQFVLLLTNNATGRTDTLVRNGKSSPLIGQLPVNLINSSRYVLSVASTSPVIAGLGQPVRILTTPTARLDLPDGSATITVLPGQPIMQRVSLSGQGPWSFALNDGTRVQNTLTTPYELTLSPTKPTVYRITTVSGPCGSGVATGEVLANVNENPAPSLSIKAPAGGYRICTGTPFQVAFSATGKFNTGNSFVAQLSDSLGRWTTISSVATTSPITTRLPYGVTPGKKFRLRIAATSPVLATDSVSLFVAEQATVLLRGDTIRIDEGKPADLTLDFVGTGPYFALLTDGTYENGIQQNPHTIRVNPVNSTSYGITSAGGACGVGIFTGRVFVKVNIPPSVITTGDLSKRIICAGAEITVPYTTTGRFYANNKWIVQVADTSGKFLNVATTVKDGIIKGIITPGYLKDTLNTVRVRIVSTSPAINGSETTINVLASNLALATVAGESTIRPGQTAKVRIAFKNGLPPWSFITADGTQVTGTFLNPYVLTVAPIISTEYTISTLSSGCGRGIATGKAVVSVDRN
jgi:hypothetical protein